MNAWQLTDTGHPAGAYPCPGDPTTLTPAQLTELAEVLRAHQDQWLITGPCLDGGWYAIPRHDQTQPRPNAPTLADLNRVLHETLQPAPPSQ